MYDIYRSILFPLHSLTLSVWKIYHIGLVMKNMFVAPMRAVRLSFGTEFFMDLKVGHDNMGENYKLSRERTPLRELISAKM